MYSTRGRRVIIVGRGGVFFVSLQKHKLSCFLGFSISFSISRFDYICLLFLGVFVFFFTVEREKREEEIGCLLFLNCYYCFGFPFSEVGFEGGFFLKFFFVGCELSQLSSELWVVVNHRL